MMAMKRILIPVLCVLMASGSLLAQNFKPSGASAAALWTREGETPVTVGGDINKDGISDLVMVVPDCLAGENFAFYFGDDKGNYTLFRDYEVSLSGRPGITITDKGVVRIQIDRDEGADIFLFRFENGDFRLIGGKEDRHKSMHYDVSYNYLTGKMIRTDGEGKGRKSTTLDMPGMPKIRFGWIPLQYDMLKYLLSEGEDSGDMEYLTVMGIFRVMQAGGMLFWHFCDYENPYRDPTSAENGWHAYDDHMSPGSYNYFATLDISKQEDGSYLLEMGEWSEDRSYETLFNEDMSNVDEVLENTEIEETESETAWIFKDGKFLLLREGE